MKPAPPTPTEPAPPAPSKGSRAFSSAGCFGTVALRKIFRMILAGSVSLRSNATRFFGRWLFDRRLDRRFSLFSGICFWLWDRFGAGLCGSFCGRLRSQLRCCLRNELAAHLPQPQALRHVLFNATFASANATARISPPAIAVAKSCKSGTASLHAMMPKSMRPQYVCTVMFNARPCVMIDTGKNVFICAPAKNSGTCGAAHC